MEWLRNLFARPAAAAPAPAPSKAGAWLAIAVVAVAGFEGLYTKAYKDPVGVVTICYGVTNDDRKVKMGDTATVQECKQWLAEDLVRYHAMAKKCIPKLDSFPAHRQAAMVSFVYNVGQGNLCKSSVARGLNMNPPNLHGTRDHPLGCDALMLWNKAGGNVLNGLTKRRAAERVDCLRSD